MNLIHQADVGMSYRESTLELRRQEALKSRLGEFQCNSLVALTVKGLIHDAHAAFTDKPGDFEAVGDYPLPPVIWA